MFGLRVVQSEFGDCLILEYGTQANPLFMLIDGGPPMIYDKHLKKELQKIANGGGKLDRVVLSHVDGDHIVGLIDFFADLRDVSQNYITIDGLWFNSFAASPELAGLEPKLRALAGAAGTSTMAPAAEVQTIGEGNELTILAQQLGITINQGFPNQFVLVETAPASVTFGNLTMKIVGPTQANLDELRIMWEKWIENHQEALNSADPFVMANSDASKPNKSSIMMHVTDGNATMLLTGDGRSDHLLQGLGAAGLLQNGKLHVNLLKLPHHGSDRNATKKFFRNVTADIYVACANGKDGNPDLATLIWIVEAAKADGRQIEIHATNETPSIEQIQDDYDKTEYGYKVKLLPKTKSSMLIEL